jgi:acyl-CoA reductase-like NAD-dependent aldehyde dehydrogenase
MTQTKTSGSLRPTLPQETARLFIDGQWVAASGGTREIVDPSTGKVIKTVDEASKEDVAKATAVARRAFDDGRWASMLPRERGHILHRAAELLRSRAEEFARLESLNTGKPITFSRMIDVNTTIEQIDYYGSLAAGLEGATRPTAAPALAYTRREPIGVIAAITPFNFPLILSSIKIAPALAAGNTVIHKPAEETPLTALLLAEVLQEAGVPDGVFNVVTGGGPAGDALVRDPRVDKIAFTGSTAIGRHIAATAAETLKHVTVELGGKNANIIFADANLEAAINTAVSGFVFNTGQFCMAGSRLLVERPVYNTVLEALGAACGHVPVGDPFVESTVIGPMTGPRHQQKV